MENQKAINMKKIIHLFVLAVLLIMGGQGFAQNKHEYVDLGLPSGTLWATCNVGANSPEEYGDYFAWGETESSLFYDADFYEYYDDDRNLTKYCNNPLDGHHGFADNLTILQASDDAATANWGSGWYTPTEAQWRELLKNTTYTSYTWDGVRGILFSGKNGAVLFLPAAGWQEGAKDDVAGDDGCYWSSSLNKDNPHRAWSCYFEWVDGKCEMTDDFGRRDGATIRPVRSKK